MCESCTDALYRVLDHKATLKMAVILINYSCFRLYLPFGTWISQKPHRTGHITQKHVQWLLVHADLIAQGPSNDTPRSGNNQVCVFFPDDQHVQCSTKR